VASGWQTVDHPARKPNITFQGRYITSSVSAMVSPSLRKRLPKANHQPRHDHTLRGAGAAMLSGSSLEFHLAEDALAISAAFSADIIRKLQGIARYR
jgi:hypothetical protein